MKLKQFSERTMKYDNLLCVISIFMLVSGIVLGSLYLFYVNAEQGTGLNEYISSWMEQIKGGSNSYAVFKKSLADNMICLALIFISGFFKFGVIFVAAAVIRKGFIMGFTAAAFSKLLGLKGLVVVASSMPGILVMIPAFLIFSTISADFSMQNDKKDKKIVIRYLMFTALTFTIFCAASLIEGYFTTIFMKYSISIIS